LLGTVAVANAASVAVPQGNPTNLVLIERLDISPAAFAARMAIPGLAAAVVCALVAGSLERKALTRPYAAAGPAPVALAGPQRLMVAVLTVAAAAVCAAPMLGVPVWWTLPPIAGAALAVHPRPRPGVRVPARLTLQLTCLLILIGWLGTAPALPPPSGVAALTGLALATGAAAALANNLPVSVSAGSLLATASSGYAATIGLGVGALATPRGSVATLIAADLAGPDGAGLNARRLAPTAIAGVLAATLVLAAMG
jgi:arsenical pump membrane protein